ncbi:hypothetical protein [Marinobacter sp. tcs-11]|nr:hypothetical protein [Marinobacter sp. tcs-11]
MNSVKFPNNDINIAGHLYLPDAFNRNNTYVLKSFDRPYRMLALRPQRA